METPGTRNIFIGLAFFAIGSVISLVTFAMASGGGVYVVAYGAIVVGGIQFVWGLIQWLYYRAQSPEQRESRHTTQGIRCLLQAMVYTAAADGVLKEREIETIGEIANQLLGQAVSSDLIRDLYAKQDRLHDSLDLISGQVPKEMRETILRACVLVALADGDFSPKEDKRLREIAKMLNYTEDSVATIARDFSYAQPAGT